MISVAIDGPTGAGKSTLAKAAAEKLGYIYVDTGACYRAIAYYAKSKGADLTDSKQVLSVLENMNLTINYNSKNEQRIIVNNDDVSDKIRTPEVSEGASLVSVIPEVREWLLETQRNLAKHNNVVMDGRDIGTVILPDARVKIFLTADDSERAMRRYKEYVAKGEQISYNKVLEDLRIRDERDTTRAVAPLKKADDAVVIDSTDLNFEETLNLIIKTIKNKEIDNVL